MRLARTTRNEEGFTLVELLITVAILSVIAIPLAGVVIDYLKTSGVTEARLTESVDQQFAATYWQADASSLGQRSFQDSDSSTPATQSVFVGGGSPGSCGSSIAGGSVVVTFAWTDFAVDAAADHAWDLTPQEAAYVSVPSGTQFVLQRMRCKDGVAGTPITVARSLIGAPTVACTPSCDPTYPSDPTDDHLPQTVSMTLAVRDTSQPGSTGYTTTLTADRRQG